MRKLLLVIVTLTAINTLGVENDVKKEFEIRYRVWKDYISRSGIDVLSHAGPRFTCSEFKEIVKLGIPAIPYIIEKIEGDPDEPGLWKAIEKIAKVEIRSRYDKEKDRVVFPDFPEFEPSKGKDIDVYWYRHGRKKTPQRFAKLYDEWQSLKKQGKEAKGKYQSMVWLGIDVIPHMVKKIERGDKDLISAISELTDGEVKETAEPTEVVNWWKINKDKWTLPPVE